ncbi:GerAB/ArcD/ProY family transporter [Alicyclobacillus sendaiensis]|uniref:GerAB/ArcD/ProY family transporter n=1 Tax=Alicyclobacillus sendaiensis TaxID=192387 RepID=UPI00078201A9|nr:GerAB/ArcD/ProY family transporter [Alicyclobacillus sendaiensis]
MVQVSRYQLILMLIWTVLGTGIVTMPGTIAQFTLRDAWIAGFGLMLGAGMCAVIALAHVRLFPGRTLTQAAIDALGPVIGRAYGIWFLAYGFVTLATIGREMSAFIGISVLPNTPDFLVSAIAFAVSMYLAYLGIEVVARVNEFILPLAAVVSPVLFLLAARLFDPSPFQPFLGDPAVDAWRAAVVPAFAYGLEFAIALQWVPALRTPRTLPWDIVIAGAISAVALSALVTLTVGVLGEPARYLNYPVLELVRAIRQGKFVERLDTLYVMGVSITLVLKLATFQLAVGEAVKDVSGSHERTWIPVPVALLGWSLSNYLFRNVFDVTNFIVRVVPGYLLTTAVLLPGVLYGIRAVQTVGAKQRRALRDT